MHTCVALAFVLTEGPKKSPVLLELSATHGVHESDLLVILLWLIGMSALGVLARLQRAK